MTELAARVALHGLRLAVAGVMVRSAALVAGCWARTAGKAATAVASKASTANGGAPAEDRAARVGRVRAGPNVVAKLIAVVATTSRACAAKAESRAVGLHVAQALAVVALLGLRGARQRAFAGLVI
jgi:hypothetical protein